MKKYNIEIELYKFSELEKSVQDKIIEKTSNEIYNSKMTDSFLEEYLYDSLWELNKSLAEDCKIYYSLSNSQGDGVSISCDYISDIKGVIETGSKNEKILESLNYLNDLGVEINVKILKNGLSNRYCHKNTASVESDEIIMNKEDYSDNGDIINKCYEVINEVQKIYEKVCDDLEKLGYEFLENISSSEYAKESLMEEELSGTLYYIDGTKFNNFLFKNVTAI